MKRLKLLLFILFCLQQSKAINYYVSPIGDDSNSGLSITTAFKTIQKALNKMNPGDNTYVVAGVYKERLIWSNSGTSTLPITLSAFNNDIAIVDGENGGTNDTQDELLLIENKSNIFIKNLHFRNNFRKYAKGIFINGSGQNINLLNNEIYNIGWSKSVSIIPTSDDNANPLLVLGNKTGSYNNITINGNKIYNCIPGYSECLTLNGNVETFEISNNQIYNNTNIGIDIAGHWAWTGAPASINFARKGVVRDNIVYNCVSKAAVAAGIYVDGASDILIERNISYNNGAGFSIGCENNNKTVSNVILRNNIAYNNEVTAMFLGSNQKNSKVENCFVTNNTFFRNSVKEQWGVELFLQNSTNCIVKQNILVPNNDNAVAIGIWDYKAEDLKIDYNLFWRTSSNKTDNMLANVTANMTILGNPDFVDANNHDFHLAATSKAINAGDPNYKAASGETDFDKKSRVQSGRIDIGAFEFGATIIANQDFFNSDKEQWIAFPNPTTGFVTINGSEKAKSIAIFNENGQFIVEKTVVEDFSQFINLTDLPNGVYYLAVYSSVEYLGGIRIVKVR